jgi:iron-sulfur cluster insertion protein
MSINIDPSAVKRIQDLRTRQNKPGLMLRITVEGGGCSGFQYRLELTNAVSRADHRFEGAVITDDMSLPFLNGAIVRYDEGLIGSEFVIENPNASSGCGCGASFAV